jgi:hypothetical protein
MTEGAPLLRESPPFTNRRLRALFARLDSNRR